jgi:hypothetical protein
MNPSPIANLLASFDAEVPPVHRCRCGLEVSQRGTICEACSEQDAEQLRTILLKPARESLPAWPHAVVTEPRFRVMVDPRIIAALRSWVPTREGLVLLGDTGRGKTTGAVAWARAMLDRARTADEVRFASGIRFANALDLSRLRRDSKLGDTPRAIRTAKACGLLILDEVGGTAAGPAELELVVEVMQARYTSNLPTLVTSGRTELGLIDRYGEPFKRRMCELATVVSCFDGRPAAPPPPPPLRDVKRAQAGDLA